MQLRALAGIHVLLLASAMPARGGSLPGAVRDLPGFHALALRPCDDGDPDNTLADDRCTDDPNVPQAIGFTIRFSQVTTSGLFVNNNGNVTLDRPVYDFRPPDFIAPSSTRLRMIAPFFADVDTRAVQGEAGIVRYGSDVVEGRRAFGVTWDDVGYYNRQKDRRNRFQLVLIERADLAAGDFDIEFNYDRIQWDTGDEPGTGAARVGIANGERSLEIEGSGMAGAFLDGNPTTALARVRLRSDQPGRLVFQVRGGFLVDCRTDTHCDDGNPCTADACRPTPGQRFGECERRPSDGATCDDGDACTEKDECAAGTCRGQARSCDDANACTEDSCDRVAGCAHGAITAACDDGNDCTDGDGCETGECREGVQVCDAQVVGTEAIPIAATKATKVTCVADPGSTCGATMFEAIGEPAGAQALAARAVAGFRVGQQVSAARSKRVGRRGRVTLKIKLNATGRQLIRQPERAGRLTVIVRTAITRPDQRARILDTLRTLLRRRP